ncbi:MAG: hypothetical protein DMF15_12830 [Verrucomicrobia bacterium]|nr:MAG: hypothetical protein DMF15_12830 [Verrucomicrobiota bacterium]PYT70444.1 MAG: hypothetical protein DMG39_15780 [Acidobacteriota bacterium]
MSFRTLRQDLEFEWDAALPPLARLAKDATNFTEPAAQVQKNYYVFATARKGKTNNKIANYNWSE